MGPSLLGSMRRMQRILPFHAVRSRLAPFSPRSGRSIALLVLLTTFGTLAESLALVLVARAAVAVASGAETITLLGSVQLPAVQGLGVALLALAIKMALNLSAGWVEAVLSARTTRTGRLALMDSYFAADHATQSRERLGELQDYLTTSVGRLNGINRSLIGGLNALIGFAVVTLAAVAIHPLAAVGCAVAAAMLLLLLRPLSRLAKEYSWAQSEATRDLAGDITEAVRVSLEVRVFGVRPAVLRALDAAEARASGPLRMGNFMSSAAPAIYQTLALVFLVLAVGAVVLTGGDQVTSLGSAVLLLLRGLTYGQQLQVHLQGLANALPFLDALHDRRALYDSHRDRRGELVLDDVGAVELQDVSFGYATGEDVLTDLTFRMERFEAVGIVGPSGSGKSTLLQLLLRLRPPRSGHVRVGGRDLWEIAAEEWSARVAFVPQDARLLHGTVADNIRFHRELTAQQVERAARLAHVHDDVMSWPLGYDTEVGDGGSRVSGGQRQRIAIARALAGGPDLLVLDEPTSALDLLSEAKLQETLAGLRGRVGLVIVAHRLSTISQCDRVLVLQGGRNLGFDEHARLLETSSFYREAVQLSLIQPDSTAPRPPRTVSETLLIDD